MNQETDELNQKNSQKSPIYDKSVHNHTSRTVENVTFDPETCIFVKSVPRIDLNEILPKNPLSSKSVGTSKFQPKEAPKITNGRTSTVRN
jgi:hypothetical protein